MNNIVEVELLYNHSNAFFKNSKFILKNNLTVIVDSDKGYQFGKVLQVFDDCDTYKNFVIGDVVRISSKKDYLHHLVNIKLADEAVIKCKDIVYKHGLNMNILDGCYNFDRSQLLFRFVADERVDFRDLAKELGTTFKTRIELRQIGIRDKAKEIGGIGPCGRLLCCSSFLKNFDSVTINMAKNQNVSLNPSKINGVCGRLLCCLKYENDIYFELKKEFPKVGSFVTNEYGKCKVLSVDVLNRNYIVELEDRSKIVVDLDDCKE